MQATSSTHHRRLTLARRVRWAHAPARAGAGRGDAAAAAVSTVSAQRAGGPQDSAFYQCGCGRGFHATVTTTVGCPGCGATQDW